MSDSNTSEMFDPAMKAALDRFDVPPLAMDFADRVLAALDHLPEVRPPLPFARPPRDRNLGWARRHITVIGATLALGVASMSAAATGVLSDFGIRIPVVTDYVTKRLGIKPVHFWHHTANGAHHDRHVMKQHAALPAPVVAIAPTPATLTASPSRAFPSPVMTAPTLPSSEARRQDTVNGRTLNGVGAAAMTGLAVAHIAHLHPLNRPAHLRLTISHTSQHLRFTPHLERGAHATSVPPILDPVYPSQRALRDRERVNNGPHEEMPTKPQKTRAEIGSTGHPIIPDEITHLQSPEERAALRSEHQPETHQPADGARAQRPIGNESAQRLDSTGQPRRNISAGEPFRSPEHRDDLNSSPKPRQYPDTNRPEHAAPANLHPFRNRPVVRNNPPRRPPARPNMMRPMRAPRERH